MKIEIYFYLVIILIGTSISYAGTTILPGVYETEGGWGTVTIKNNQFKISTMGENGHTCNLAGKIIGTKGITTEEYSSDACKIIFEAQSSTIEIKIDTDDACRAYCGARADFTGKYYIPASECAIKSRKERRKDFLKFYTEKQYITAYEKLSTLNLECGNFFNWIEKDQIKNDLAVTLFHIENKNECLNVLKTTLGWEQKTVEDLQNYLPPTDYEIYLPVAKATWNNIKLCQKLK